MPFLLFTYFELTQIHNKTIQKAIIQPGLELDSEKVETSIFDTLLGLFWSTVNYCLKTRF